MNIIENEFNIIVDSIRNKIHNTLDYLIPCNSSCILVDFPHHSNVGDSAIWLGEMNYLNKRRCKIIYCCDIGSYDFVFLRKNIGNSIILIHGGGNFGDLWPTHQEFRERIVSDFPNNRIVQLPQSIYFSDSRTVKKSQDIFSKHSDLHLVVRDYSSYEWAKKHYSNSIYLCPDMAMMLDIKSVRNKLKLTELVVLSRNDKEKLVPLNINETLEFQFQIADWLIEESPKYQRLYHWAHNRIRWKSKIPNIILLLIVNFAAYSMAKERLERGLNILGAGSYVLTDRLHAIILSRLCGLPVFFVDNNYGKLSNFVDTWLCDDINIKKYSNFETALNDFVNIK